MRFARFGFPHAAWVLLALLLAACSGEQGARSGDADGRPQGILLITVDGLVPEHLSVFGGPIAVPPLERLAAGGRAWQDAWTACPMPRPAVTTYLTGLAPDRHGVLDDLDQSLPGSVSTLATVLGDRGYQTAAFPNSSFLDWSSGLLDAFDVVDDPLPIPRNQQRWIPLARPSKIVAGNVVAWLESIQPGERYFGWIHLVEPLQGQMAPGEKGAERRFGQFNEALTRILESLDARADPGETVVLLAGTLGDVRGGEQGMEGMGFSLDPATTRVPVILHAPRRAASMRDAGLPVWAPDVAVTLAELGGATLPGAEGTSLFEDPEAHRVLRAWSWAPWNQLGWKPLRSAQVDGFLRVEGQGETVTVALGEEERAPDEATLGRLDAAWDGRDAPALEELALDEVRPLLESLGLKPAMVAREGRDFDSPEKRREIASALWSSRKTIGKAGSQRSEARLVRILELDPENLGALLARGRTQLRMSEGPEGPRLLRRLAELYPTRPDAVHWFAHSIWHERWADAEKLIELVRPLRPGDADLQYDLACARSLDGDLERSAEFLRSAIEGGYRDWSHMESDPDLRNLRESGRFAEIMREFRQ